MPDKTKSRNIKIPINYASLAVVLLIIAGVVLYSQFGSMIVNKGAKVGDLVVVDYVGTLEDGTVFDTSVETVAIQNGIVDSRRTYEPLEFTIGAEGLIKGFDNAAIGMKAGQTKRVILQPEEAYGSIRQDLVVTVNTSDIQTSGQPLVTGGRIFLENGAQGVIIKIENGSATIDFNHQFAGKILIFEIKLVKIIR